MAFLNLVDASDPKYGGKIANLSRLTQKALPVPQGWIFTSIPTEQEWAIFQTQWQEAGAPAVAVRSSASGEDSSDHSFAGQNKTFLNLENLQDIKDATQACFESLNSAHSSAYQEHFQLKNPTLRMNVLIQKMVEPQFAGVFFSCDPRSGKEEWILEVVEGLGEKLVSGQVTPKKYGPHSEALPFFTEEILRIARIASEDLNHEVDLEWAVDQNNQVQLLQCRPITTLLQKTDLERIQDEKERIQKKFDAKTTFDGKTFSEWMGTPSPLTRSLWQQVFYPNAAFDRALRNLGYEGFAKGSTSRDHTLLNLLFGRPYLNLDRLSDLYFGDQPFVMKYEGSLKVHFSFQKLRPRHLFTFPLGLFHMIRVAFELSSQRKSWIKRSRQELKKQKLRIPKWKNTSDLALLRNEWCQDLMVFPFILSILIESTYQRIFLLISRIQGPEQAKKTLQEWMGHGVHTVTQEMQEAFQDALHDESKRPAFFQTYGHRGAGEMDLSNPRFSETNPFRMQSTGSKNSESWHNHKIGVSIEKQIENIHSFTRYSILEEWNLLRDLIEEREEWKMLTFHPLFQIRKLLLSIELKVKPLEISIFDLTWDELNTYQMNPDALDLMIVKERKLDLKAFRRVRLPEWIPSNFFRSFNPLQEESKSMSTTLQGESLSPGWVEGVAYRVTDILNENPDLWPDNVILITESTDPGWTPYFLKAKGIIVEHGGVLSHAAILAREIGIPAISQIPFEQTQGLQNQTITLDGTQGKIHVTSR